MARKNINGIIEAVRYSSDGRIIIVRAFERRGAVWSDHVILNRRELSGMLEQGKCFVTGDRKPYLGNSFTIGLMIHQDEGNITTSDKISSHDFLECVPIF